MLEKSLKIRIVGVPVWWGNGWSVVCESHTMTNFATKFREVM